MINISIWIIATVVFVNAIWLFTFILSWIFELDTLFPRYKNFHTVFLSVSLGVVMFATLLNICLNLSLIAQSKLEPKTRSGTEHFNWKNLSYVVFLLLCLTAIIFSIHYFNRFKERDLIIKRWTTVIQKNDHRINEITASISDSSKIENLPKVLRELGSVRIENPDIFVISSDTIKNHLEFVEIAWSFGDEKFYKKFQRPVFYKALDNEREYLEKIFTTNSTDIYVWTEKKSFRLFHPIDRGKRKYVLLFVYYEADPYYYGNHHQN